MNSAVVLDLFSGVGSFGLECLSRGVNEVILLKIIQAVQFLKNLTNLRTINNYNIIEEDIFNENFLLSLKKKIDIIFRSAIQNKI